MVEQMEAEGFGACSNEGECQAVCPKEISVNVIQRMNREYLRSSAEDGLTGILLGSGGPRLRAQTPPRFALRNCARRLCPPLLVTVPIQPLAIDVGVHVAQLTPPLSLRLSASSRSATSITAEFRSTDGSGRDGEIQDGRVDAVSGAVWGARAQFRSPKGEDV